MDASSDSEEESFVELGKPLPFVEGEGKKKPITLQDAPSRSAQDSKGRPRFHGAFTGGFSAGFFNTVGSKEGWTPSTFVSSRQQKQTATGQRPEDFMDEEDLGEHGIAPRHFATSDLFSSDARNRKRKAEVMSVTRDSILPASAALADLIVPERLPIGIKLLRKMGWKEGQGVGPRVKKKGRRRKNSKAPGVKIYGCAPPPASDDSSESDASDIDLQNVTFAPKDVTPISLTAKDNVHGLGYSGLDPRSALPATHVNLFERAAVRSSKSGKGIRGQGFGVGALEDEDEDIYATESMCSYDQTMELDDSEQFFGWTAPGARKKKGKQDRQQVPVSYVGKLLEGFTLSAKPLAPKKVFPAPRLPKGFQPFHKFKKTVQQLAQEAVGEKPAAATQQGSGQQKLNAVERGLMLGETPIAASVFDLIPKEDIRKMEAVKEAAKMAASRFQSAGSQSQDSDPVPPRTEASSGQSSSQVAETPGAPVGGREQAPLFSGGVGVKPFRNDPAKQDRYDRYLLLVKQGVQDAYKAVAGSNMTEWERQREQEEFAKASKIYRPLANMMASRFTRGAFIDDSEQQQSGIVDTVAEKSEEAKAAEMKMYGRLTREDMEWHPHKLLCKRFNVPNPYPESDIVGVPGLKRDKFSIFNFLSVPTHSSAPEASTTQETPSAQETTTSLTRELNASKRKKGAMSIFSVLEEEENTPRRPPPALALTASDDKEEDPKTADEEKKVSDEMDEKEDRPLDLFRAIFKNSDSESSSASEKSGSDKSDDDDGDEKADKKEEKKAEGHTSPTPAVSEPQEKIQSTAPSSDQTSVPKEATTTTPHSPPQPPPPLPSQSPSASTQPKRKKASRWGVGSIFDVLDQSPPQSIQPGETSARNGEERLSPHASEEVPSEEEYGPSLPPPGATGMGSVKASASASSQATSDTHRNHKHKHREERDTSKHRQERDTSKHRHKKEKKKKSKHKKKKKKQSKHLHKERHKKYSSGSDADSESDSDS